MYSPTPALSDVLFYTSTDSYNYMTDNRPIYQLDSNIKAVASSLVGNGYGEHAAISGGTLTPGKAVELLPNGLIRYPSASTVAGQAILGLVIGVSGAGLSRVLWSTSLLDLGIVGLVGILPTGSTSGQYLISSADSTGSITLSSSFTSSDLVLGVVRNNNFISIGKDGLPVVNPDSTPKYNAVNNYGVTRRRNFELLAAIDAAPLQYTKNTTYMDPGSLMNPLMISYNYATGQILPDTTPTVTDGLASWILKETYKQFVSFNNSDAVYVGAVLSTWPAVSFQTTLSGGTTNYELASVNGSLDFTTNLNNFKQFAVSKYYQYARVASSNILFGKVTATVTVFDSSYGGSVNYGGETGKILVCDFFSYNASSGLEVKKNRIVVTGTAADNLYSNTSIFPTTITSSL